MVLAGCGPSEPPPAFKIAVESPGVYAVTWDDLSRAGLGKARPSVTSLGIEHLGQAVPIWVEDGGDGTFDPGDRLEFIGQARRGEKSHYSEFDPWSIYRLRFDHPQPTRFAGREPAPPVRKKHRTTEALTVREHLEREELLLRFTPDKKGEIPEPWYWAKLSMTDKEPWSQVIDLGALDRRSPRPLTLRVGLRGWSSQKRKTPDALADHRVEVLINGRVVASGEWNDQEAHVIEVLDVPRTLLGDGDQQTIELRVPKRQAPTTRELLIDVVMLNWIELEYPRHTRLRRDQARFEIVEHVPDVPLRLATETATWLYDGHSRTSLGPRKAGWFRPPQGGGPVHVVRDGGWHSPGQILVDHASALETTEQQADYLMIAHASLIHAIEPLAEFHRRRGLTVEVIDVADIYDEFSHGEVDPRAIRDFVSHAYHHWQEPRPRFVLLVGDASWETRTSEAQDQNYVDWTFAPPRRFAKNRSTSYEDRTGAGRHLIPTWHFQTRQGHAASDNYFVRVDGDDFYPDLAIGRLPVIHPEEVEAIVAKTVRYVDEPEVGPWRRRMLWITSENKLHQIQNDALARRYGRTGFAATKVYPQRDDVTSEHHQEDLLRAFDEGNFLVHFLGHGGRYIWRTGPPDIAKQSDLFTLDHLDRLQPNRRLPLVLSLTCYSAPFDHPTADSIGEKFLRLADRGAVAVFAASWRNNPGGALGDILIRELLEPGTLGEAIQRAKSRLRNAIFVETYNLLGDPAIPLSTPQLELEISTLETEAGRLLDVTVPGSGFDGQAIVDWHDADGEPVGSVELAFDDGSFRIPFPARGELAASQSRRDANAPSDEGQSIESARVYVWNEKKRLDGLGGLVLPKAVSKKDEA